MTNQSLSQISINAENLALLKKKEGYTEEEKSMSKHELIDLFKLWIWFVILLLMSRKYIK